MTNQTYIEKIYCTREALSAVETFDFCGMPIKPASIEFFASQPQMMAANGCPFRIIHAHGICIVHMPEESFPMKAMLLAYRKDGRWHYADHKEFATVNRQKTKKKKYRRDTISARFFS